MPSVFEKLHLKAQPQIVVVNAPGSFEPELARLVGIEVLRSPEAAQAVSFALAFVVKADERNSIATALTAKAAGDATLWFAYPKKTSKRYRCEFDRDTGWHALGQAGYEAVRMVAIDEDWSGLRFRRVEFIRSLTRDPARALSGAGKRRASAA